MRRAKLIEGLKIKEIQAYGPTHEIIPDMSLDAIPVEDNVLMGDFKRIQCPIIPLGKLNRITREPEYRYIVYSPEVEELLEMPFSALHREVGDLKAQMEHHTIQRRRLKRAINEATWLERLKYLFTRKLGNSDKL